MSLKPFKFLIQMVLLETNGTGDPIGERTSEQPVVLYGVQAVRDFLDNVERDIEAQNEREEIEHAPE